jgi:small GTP-binding protein
MNSENIIIQKKICMLGDFAIGKTSLVRRFVYNLFDDRYMNTIGVNISRKEVSLSDHLIMRLMIWDLSATDKFNKNRSDYLHGTAGALLVCDLTRPETISKLQSHYIELLYKSNPDAFVVLVGNKVDLANPNFGTMERVIKLASDLNVSYQITSAKTGESVESTFLLLAEGLYNSHG